MSEPTPQIPDETNLQDDPLRYILYICCTLCCCGILMFLLPLMMAMLGMTGLTPDSLLSPTDRKCVEDCLLETYGPRGSSTGPCTYTGNSIDESQRKNINTVISFLTSKGLNKTQAAAIAGNFQQESQFSPTALNPDSGAYGLAQWYGSRHDALSSYCESTNQPIDSLQAQLEFFWKEFTGPALCNVYLIPRESIYGEKYYEEGYKSLYSFFPEYTKIEDLVGTFHDLFECSDDLTPFTKRVNYAKAIFENMQCQDISSGPTSNDDKTYISGIKHYNQKQYPNVKLDSVDTIESAGCGFVSTVMAVNYANSTDIDPGTYYTTIEPVWSTIEQNKTLNGKDATRNGSGTIQSFATTETGSTVTEFKYDTNSIPKITGLIDQGTPMVAFTGFMRTSNTDGNYGHIVLIIGYTKDSSGQITSFIVNDPYEDHGTVYTGVKNNGSSGEMAKYEITDFTKYMTNIVHSQDPGKLFYIEGSSQKCKELSLEEKIGQILMVNEANFTTDELEKLKIGSIIMMGGSEDNSLAKIKTITNTLKIKPIIASDIEGGVVNRLKYTSTANNCSNLPSAANMSDPKTSMTSCGKDMKSFGINMNLAPVVDPNLSDSPISADGRTFDGDITTEASNYIDGLILASVIPTLKHFPGYPASAHTDYEKGTSSEDPYQYIKPFDDLKQKYGNKVAIMMNSITYTKISSENAAYTKEIVDKARNGFNGLIITDDLNAVGASLSTNDSTTDRVEKAINAGNDIIMLVSATSGTINEVITNIANKARENEALKNRIEESYNRVITAKKQFNIIGSDSEICGGQGGTTGSTGNNGGSFPGYTQQEIDDCIKKCQEQTQTISDVPPGGRCWPIIGADGKEATLEYGNKGAPNGPRHFKASRPQGDCPVSRAHAGFDLIVGEAGPGPNNCGQTGASWPVIAIESGTVEYVKENFYCGKDYIMVKNDADGSFNGYGEVNTEPFITQGTKIRAGQQIATVDDIGPCCMMHFERPLNANPDGCSIDLPDFQDPYPYLQTTSEQCSTPSTTPTVVTPGEMPHYCQTTDDGCGPTALLMLLQSQGFATSFGERSFYDDYTCNDSSKCVRPLSQSTNMDYLEKQMKKHIPQDKQSCIHRGATKQEIINLAKQGIPVVVGTYYYYNIGIGGFSGHYVTIKSYQEIDGVKNLIINNSGCYQQLGYNGPNEPTPIDKFFDPTINSITKKANWEEGEGWSDFVLYYKC